MRFDINHIKYESWIDMSILNVNMEDTTSQVKKAQVMYNIMQYRDDLCCGKVIVMDVDENCNPTLIGWFADRHDILRGSNNQYKGYQLPTQAWALSDIEKALSRIHNNNWNIPTTHWFTNRFGLINKTKWLSPQYDKFYCNAHKLSNYPSLIWCHQPYKYIQTCKLTGHSKHKLNDVSVFKLNMNKIGILQSVDLYSNFVENENFNIRHDFTGGLLLLKKL